MPDNGATVDLDWENRLLCSDESCIGIIGPDGNCKECGKTYEGQTPLTGSESTEIPTRVDPRGSSESPEAEMKIAQHPRGKQ